MSTSWPRLLLIYGIGVLSAGQLGIVPPLVPALQSDLGLALATAGVIVSIVTLVGGLLGLPAGAWAERIGHGRAFGLGLLVMAIGGGLCAMAPDWPMLLAARTLAGVGYLLVVVAGPSLMATLSEPRHQPLALSLWGTFVPVGIALAGIATAVAAGTTGWRTIFAVDAVLLLAALAAATPLLRPGPMTRTTDWRLPAGTLGAAAPLAVAFFCFALLFLALAGMLPAYLVEQRAISSATAGAIVAVATALGIVGSAAAAWSMNRGASPARLIGNVGRCPGLPPRVWAGGVDNRLRRLVRDRRAGAGSGLRRGAEAGARRAGDRTDQRRAGASREPGIARRAAIARAMGQLDRLVVGTGAVAGGGGRGRDQRQCKTDQVAGFRASISTAERRPSSALRERCRRLPFSPLQ
jgi:MFS family permease